MVDEGPERSTRLVGKKGKFTFAAWVEIEGRPVKVYNEVVAEDGALEAWIPSEQGKCYSLCFKMMEKPTRTIARYPDMLTRGTVDGFRLKKRAYPGAYLRVRGGMTDTFADRRISKTQAQKPMFAKPQLTEDETPGLALDKLATIEVCFRRCQKERLEVGKPIPDEKVASATAINETSKKEALLSAITDFGQPQVRASKDVSNYDAHIHPEDMENGFYKIRFRYAPEDYLQALGYIPLNVNIQPGEVGLKKDHPIAIDDDEPQAGPSKARRASVANGLGGEVKEEKPLPHEENSSFAQRIAAARAELEALETQQRLEQSAANRRRRPEDDDDNKDNIVRAMGKKLKVAKKGDNGFVDLTVDDE